MVVEIEGNSRMRFRSSLEVVVGDTLVFRNTVEVGAPAASRDSRIKADVAGLAGRPVVVVSMAF